MLELKNVTMRFGALVAVNNLSFVVKKGGVYGIAGTNRAGKSTVYNLITGFFKYEGNIIFDGKDITGLSSQKIAQLGISRTFQIPQTFPSLTVEKSIDVGNRFGNTAKYDPSNVDRIIDFIDLQKDRKRKTGNIDLLGKKKLMIGAALATNPKILMLDEPMAGSCRPEMKALMELIRRMNTELGITIIIIEHFMKVLTELTDTLLIIESGTEICSGDPKKVTNDPKVIECYLGGKND